MKKLLTVALTASLCLSSFTLFGCVDPHLGTDPETTAAIISESTAETAENVTEREEPVIIRVPVSAEVLEVRGDGLYKIIMRKPYYETGDANDFYDKEMLLRTTDIEPCVGDRITFTYKGLTDEIIDGLPVCKTSKVEFFNSENMTDKPVIYAANIAEDMAAEDEDSIDYVVQVKKIAQEEQAEVLVISAQIEEEIAQMDPDEKSSCCADAGNS